MSGIPEKYMMMWKEASGPLSQVWSWFQFFSALLVIGLVIFLIFAKKRPRSNFTNSENAFATAIRTLNKKGYYYVGSSDCGYCTKQKTELGPEVENITFFDCKKDDAMCKRHKIMGFPTWIGPEGEKYPGFKTKDDLIELSKKK